MDKSSVLYHQEESKGYLLTFADRQFESREQTHMASTGLSSSCMLAQECSQQPQKADAVMIRISVLLGRNKGTITKSWELKPRSGAPEPHALDHAPLLLVTVVDSILVPVCIHFGTPAAPSPGMPRNATSSSLG